MVEQRRRGGEGGKKESARSFALSVLNMARVEVPVAEDLRAGMRTFDASDGSSVTYLLAT